MLINIKKPKSMKLNYQSQSIILVINVKMPRIVGILTLMSRINYLLSRVQHEKGFITTGPEVIQQNYFPIDSKALQSLREAPSCVIAIFDRIVFVTVVKLNNSCKNFAT